EQLKSQIAKKIKEEIRKALNEIALFIPKSLFDKNTRFVYGIAIELMKKGLRTINVKRDIKVIKDCVQLTNVSYDSKYGLHNERIGDRIKDMINLGILSIDSSKQFASFKSNVLLTKFVQLLRLEFGSENFNAEKAAVIIFNNFDKKIKSNSKGILAVLRYLSALGLVSCKEVDHTKADEFFLVENIIDPDELEEILKEILKKIEDQSPKFIDAAIVSQKEVFKYQLEIKNFLESRVNKPEWVDRGNGLVSRINNLLNSWKSEYETLEERVKIKIEDFKSERDNLIAKIKRLNDFKVETNDLVKKFTTSIDTQLIVLEDFSYESEKDIRNRFKLSNSIINDSQVEPKKQISQKTINNNQKNIEKFQRDIKIIDKILSNLYSVNAHLYETETKIPEDISWLKDKREVILRELKSLKECPTSTNNKNKNVAQIISSNVYYSLLRKRESDLFKIYKEWLNAKNSLDLLKKVFVKASILKHKIQVLKSQNIKEEVSNQLSSILEKKINEEEEILEEVTKFIDAKLYDKCLDFLKSEGVKINELESNFKKKVETIRKTVVDSSKDELSNLDNNIVKLIYETITQSPKEILEEELYERIRKIKPDMTIQDFEEAMNILATKYVLISRSVGAL
ncbi:MAG: hypothetical protein ACXADY_22035, partial [Candidatus Hodarchaeales archaeon]